MTRVFITDHALLRWLERVHDIDVAALRASLAEIAQPYADARVKHAFAGGVWLVFHDERLVTVTPEKPKPVQSVRHDRDGVNGTAARGEPRHWKHKQRRGTK